MQAVEPPGDTKRHSKWHGRRECVHCHESKWIVTHGLCRICVAIPGYLERYPKLGKPPGRIRKPSTCHPFRMAKTASGQCGACYDFERRYRLRVIPPGLEQTCTACGLTFQHLRAGGLCWRCTLPATSPGKATRRRRARARALDIRDLPMEAWYALAHGCGSIDCQRPQCGALALPAIASGGDGPRGGVYHRCTACGWSSALYWWQESGAPFFSQPDDRLSHLPPLVVAQAKLAAAWCMGPAYGAGDSDPSGLGGDAAPRDEPGGDRAGVLASGD